LCAHWNYFFLRVHSYYQYFHWNKDFYRLFEFRAIVSYILFLISFYLNYGKLLSYNLFLFAQKYHDILNKPHQKYLHYPKSKRIKKEKRLTSILLSSKKSGDNSSKEGHITLCVIDFSRIFTAQEKKLFIS